MTRPDGGVKRSGVVDYLNEKITDVSREYAEYQQRSSREIAQVQATIAKLRQTEETITSMNADLLEENVLLREKCEKYKRKASDLGRRHLQKSILGCGDLCGEDVVAKGSGAASQDPTPCSASPLVQQTSSEHNTARDEPEEPDPP